jgi:hypothetical protein
LLIVNWLFSSSYLAIRTAKSHHRSEFDRIHTGDQSIAVNLQLTIINPPQKREFDLPYGPAGKRDFTET